MEKQVEAFRSMVLSTDIISAIYLSIVWLDVDSCDGLDQSNSSPHSHSQSNRGYLQCFP